MEVLYTEDTAIVAMINLAMAKELLACMTLTVTEYFAAQTAGLLADKLMLIIHAKDYAEATAYLGHPTSRPNLIVSDFEFPGKPTKGPSENSTGKQQFTVGGVELYADVTADYNNVLFTFLSAGEVKDIEAELKKCGLFIDASLIFAKPPGLVEVIKSMCQLYTPVTPGPLGDRAWIPYHVPKLAPT